MEVKWGNFTHRKTFKAMEIVSYFFLVGFLSHMPRVIVAALARIGSDSRDYDSNRGPRRTNYIYD